MAKIDKKAVDQEKTTVFSEVSKKFRQSPGLYIGSVVVLVLVTVSFIGGDFLSGSQFGSSDDWVFGYYDKTPIVFFPGNTFSQFYENTRSRVPQNMDPNDFRVQAQIWRHAFEQTVVHTAMLDMVKRSNYEVPEKSVDRVVAQLPRFMDHNGRFSPTIYRQVPESTRHTIWRQVKDELVIEMFTGDLSRVMIPKGEAQFIASMASPIRSFSMVSFSIDDYPESEFLSYADENQELFNSIHLSIITITGSEREARRVLASIKDGVTTFEDAARVNSKDGYADMGGDMGTRYFFELTNDIPNPLDRENIYNLRKDEISDVVAVNDGWAIFRVENEKTAANFDDSFVMDRVRSHVRSFAPGRMEDWAIEQANDFIKDAAESGFDNAARWLNKERQSFGPLPINYSGVDFFTALESFTISGLTRTDLQDISRNERFWRIAFSTPVNTTTDPFVHGSNVFVFFPTEEKEADEYTIEMIESSYSWQLNNISEQSMRSYFLTSERASSDDFFWDAYFRFVMP
ncbi:MAG: SurA N-terminal domain-containing protein [Treponema sp.]|jgi:hypothetical protein|nr:SurA N-terminal domain-containing protein [Treponema sp.]